ncbi:MAG TPA: hypothetical protein VH700_02070 [Gemmatimonadales bacterium]|jgi:hypothetical protein
MWPLTRKSTTVVSWRGSPSGGKRSARAGFALEATLILLVLLTALISAALATTIMVQRTAGVDYRAARATYAAESGADHVMAQLEADVQDGSISDAELAALTPPAISGFNLTVRGTRVGAAVPRTIANGPYAGLFGLNQQIDITVHADDPNANRADAVVSVNAQTIPLFQFGVFYEEDLEIHNGPPMSFAGWVHTNGNLYLSSDNTFFQDLITTPGTVTWDRKAYADRRNGIWINNAAAVPVNLTFDSRSKPVPNDFRAASQASFDGRLMTAAHGVTPLRLPLPAGMPAVELIRPRAGDPPEVQKVKEAWLADLYVTVDLNQLGATCAAPGTPQYLPRPNGRQAPDAVDCALIFRGRPNAFFDGREDIGVDVLDVDVGALGDWIAANQPGRRVDILYITFINANAGVATADFPAVRLINGSVLRYPLTVATDRPVYVKGDYNSGAWRPAAILSDAVTFLSAGWDDAAHAGFPANPTAASGEMWVFAAIAAGHSATPCDYQVAGCLVQRYGGGLENFPRFLERWSGVQMHYRGSLVSLFQSQFANLHDWNWRHYYDPPNRDWQFDTRFRDPTQLPPGTPVTATVSQIAFRPVY